MIRINLLPAKFRKTKGAQRLTAYGIIGLAALALVMVLALLGLISRIHSVNREIAQTDAESAKLADKIAYLRGLTSREAESEAVRQTIRRLLPEQATWITLLDDLARLVREDLWLTRLALRPEPVPGQLPLALSGEAYTKLSAADFLTALETSERFTEVQLVALTDTRTASASLVTFQVKCNYRPESAAAGGKP